MRRSRRGEKEKAAGVAQWCEVRGNMGEGWPVHIFRIGISTVELDTVNTLKMQIPPP